MPTQPDLNPMAESEFDCKISRSYAALSWGRLAQHQSIGQIQDDFRSANITLQLFLLKIVRNSSTSQNKHDKLT